MKKSTLYLTALLLASGGFASAGEWRPAKNLVPPPAPVDANCLTYDFIDLQYIQQEFGSRYFHRGNGYGFGLSKSLTDSLYIDGSYSFGEFEDLWCGCFDDAETRRYRFGAGIRQPIAECVDLTFAGGADHLETEYATKSERDFDSWGYYVGPGIRAKVGRLEWFANAYYSLREGDYSQNHISSEFRNSGYAYDPYGWRFSSGFIFHVTDRLGLKVAAELEDYDNSFLVGVRYHY